MQAWCNLFEVDLFNVSVSCGYEWSSGIFRGIGDLKVTLISSFVNMSVRVVFAAVLVFHFSLQIEALPFSYLAGWIGMLVAEVPLLLRKL